jgi:amidohydrolase
VTESMQVAEARTERNAELDGAVESFFERMVEVRRQLHRQPEPSGEERETSRFLLEQLTMLGLPGRLGPDGRGVIGESAGSEGAAGAPLIAMRADIDALHIQDAKDVEYRSARPGVMHACGHDGHAATVLGAAAALTSMARAGRLPWPVRWRAIFQPSEETNRGALEMIEAGALEGVGAILSQHMDPSRPVGEIALKAGAFTADCVELAITIHGQGGHAARPHESLDPIATAAQLISSVYLFVPRATDSQDPVVVSFGQIRGGEDANVIPDRVVLRGTVRCLSEAVRLRTLDHIGKLARGLAEASGTRIEMKFIPGPPAVNNDYGMTELVRGAAIGVVGADHVKELARPSMGGEDFANYLSGVRGCMFRLGCAPPGGRAPQLHSPLFDLDERAMSIGAKILARAVVAWSEPARHAEEAR